MQISLVFQKSASIVNFLREKKLSTRHSLSLVSMTLPSYVSKQVHLRLLSGPCSKSL